VIASRVATDARIDGQHTGNGKRVGVARHQTLGDAVLRAFWIVGYWMMVQVFVAIQWMEQSKSVRVNSRKD